MTISKKASQFRKDGSQTYDYYKTRIFGREIIDGFFMSIRYDIGREFPSYGLKPIIEYLGLEKEDRIKWDFEKNDPNEIWNKRLMNRDYQLLWQQYKEYCTADADDSLTLFDLMVAPYFFLTTNIPMSFQSMYESASGAQINKFLIRGYLQRGHSIPLPTISERYQGAISFGIPGVYRNCLKIDVASLYPSIMRQYKVYDDKKDPLKLFLEMIDTFTKIRLENKRLAKETGDKYYTNLEQSQKLLINSGYGFMGANGLNFNSPKNAAFVTAKGREILSKAIMWATGKPVDTWLAQLNDNSEEESQSPHS
jgi:DNA polymerase elongation subunit (family B)